MSDANEDMIREFESVFFPELLKNEVIANHLAAADEADANKPALAKAHRDYAAALTNGSEDLETDAVGAAAALNEQDYATFIAKGVRFSNNSDSRTDNFRRTVKVDFSSADQKIWSQARSVTRQRQTSSPVALATKQRFGPALGVYSGAQISYNSLQPIYGWVSRTGLLVGGLHPAGALAAAGVMPGMILMRVDGQQVQSMADIGRALEYLEPGQTIPVEVLENTGGWINPMTPVWGTNKYYTVTVGSYPMPPEERN
jgi:hypothetical protein